MPDEDAIKTHVMTRANWLPPVENVDQLPLADVGEGTRCFVDPDGEEDEQIWEFRQGRWVRVLQV